MVPLLVNNLINKTWEIIGAHGNSPPLTGHKTLIVPIIRILPNNVVDYFNYLLIINDNKLVLIRIGFQRVEREISLSSFSRKHFNLSNEM